MKKIDKIDLRKLPVQDLTDMSYQGKDEWMEKVDTETFAQAINDISSSFCIAKWKQTTLHLQNGHTHSCHHPRPHVVPVEEVKKNPSALHNTRFKKQRRKEM